MNDNREEQLEKLFAAYVDRLNFGEKIDADTILAENPLFGEELLMYLEEYLDVAAIGENKGPLGTLGDYTLRRQIGRGGMGVVYEAWENSMDRRVALKVMPKAVAVDTRAVARFIQEAQLAGKLSHPNIVHIHGMGVKEQVPYYAMDFVEGETLAQIVARLKEAEEDTETPFGRKDDVRYFANLAEAFADVANGLQHAHSHKVIHRDIKPSNLILDREGRLRILDFGLARLEGQESLTISGDMVGTPQYMSPEQARRKKIAVDHRTDIYSLGATLYEMLTLEPPFRGKDHQDTLSQIIERDPPRPSGINPRVPRDLETIVLKCLRKDAGDRYGTAEALGQDLGRFVRGEIIEARPEGNWERLARRIAQRRKAIFAGVLVLVAVACTAALLIVLRQRDFEQRAARYRTVVEDAILSIELAHAGPVEWEDAPPWDRSASDVDEWFGEHQRQLLEQAVGALRTAARDLPRRPEAYYHTARALRLLRRDEEAERELRSAQRRDRERVLPGLLENDAGEASDGASWSERWMRLRFEKLPIAERLRSYGDLSRELRLHGEPYAGLQLELRIEQGRAALQAGEHQRAVEIFGGLHQERPEAYTTALLLARAYYLLGQREQARRVGADALRVTPQASEAALAFAVLHSHFGEKGWCKEAIGAIADRASQLEAKFHLLSGNLSRDEALQLDSELVAVAEPSARVYDVRAYLSTYDLQDPLRGAAIAEEGLQKFPRDGGLHDTLGWCLFYAGDFQQATAAFERVIALEPFRSRTHNGIGFAQYRLGNLERSEAAFTEALRLYPRLTFPYYGRGKVRYIRGDLPAAVDDFAQCLLLAPGHSAVARCLGQVLGGGGENLLEPYWNDLRRSFSRALSRQVKYPRLLGLLALSELHASPPDPSAALAHSEEAAAAHGYRDPWLLDCLAQAQQATGDARGTLGTLERAVEWVDVYPVLGRRLAAYRQAPGGAFLTCRSLDDAAADARAAGTAAVRSFLLQARSTLRSRGDVPLLRYLDSDQALASGDTLGALRLLEQAVTSEGGDDEAAIARYAELLGSSGRRDEALDLLEERILPQSVSPGRWASWLRIAAAEPPLPWSALLEREILNDGSRNASNLSLAGDVRWVLEELAGAGALRLNCAGEDHTDALGLRWGADRFFCAGEGVGTGRPFNCAPANVRDPAIYSDQRWSHAPFGYRIPVPPGRYELALHFFEIWGQPGGQRFDVILNGSPLLEGHAARSPERPRDAEVVRIPISAPEGLVSLLFVLKEGYVSVAGIELRWLGR